MKILTLLKVTGWFSHDLLHLIMTENDILGHSHLSWPFSLPNYKESESKNLLQSFSSRNYMIFMYIENLESYKINIKKEKVSSLDQYVLMNNDTKGRSFF